MSTAVNNGASVNNGIPAKENYEGVIPTHQHNNGLMNGRDYAYGDNDLERSRTVNTHAAFGGAFAPGPYNEQKFRKFANVAPLGLSAFALTTFILSLVNAGTRNVGVPDIVIGSALAYGGLVQLLAGMWEVAIGNTFGAVALSSYGGFWISFAILITTSPGQSWGVIESYGTNESELNNAIGFYLIGWFIFNTLLLLCTLRSTVAFFSLFFFLDITFLLLAIARFEQTAAGGLNVQINKAGGIFGIITAFIAWYNALAGMLEKENSFFTIPVAHFPWSEKVRSERRAENSA